MARGTGFGLLAVGAIGVALLASGRDKPQPVSNFAPASIPAAPSSTPSPPVTPRPASYQPTIPSAPVPPQSFEASRPTTAATRYVRGKRVPLRAEPAAKARVLDRLSDGQELIELARRGAWVNVRHPLSQREGWISASRIASAPPAASDAPEKKPESNVPDRILTSAAIVALIIAESVADYRASRPCACPYNTDRAGRSCGARSAYSRPGGAAPLCYARDVTPEMVAEYRQRRR